jgi:hypothetical protein
MPVPEDVNLDALPDQGDGNQNRLCPMAAQRVMYSRGVEPFQKIKQCMVHRRNPHFS